MDVQEAISKARDAISVGRVYGEPYERDGLTVIPAAVVRGGAGGGYGESAGAQTGDGGGGGFGLIGRPAGAYVIQDGAVRWEPALDFTALILRAQLLAAAVVLVLRLVGSRR